MPALFNALNYCGEQLDARWSLPGQSEVNSQRLLTAAGRRNATWNRVVAPVPLAPYLALRFTFSVPPMEQVETTFAAVDDISIKLGECPAFGKIPLLWLDCKL